MRGLQTGLGYLQGTGVGRKMNLQGQARHRRKHKNKYKQKETLTGTYSKDVLVKKADSAKLHSYV